MCMVEILRFICGFILVFVVSYIIGSIVSWEWSISAWNEDSRIFTIIISSIGGIVNAM